MAHEPPCWILDKDHKDTGKRNYSLCRPMVCTVTCGEACGRRVFVLGGPVNEVLARVKDQKEVFLALLKDVDVREAIKAIVTEEGEAHDK